MNAKLTLSPEEVRQLMHPLRYESRRIEILIGETKKRIRKNKQQIRGIQAQCPHENVKLDPTQDCANKKICIDCGARVQIRA